MFVGSLGIIYYMHYDSESDGAEYVSYSWGISILFFSALC
jgi:hypothetical protein